MMFSYENDKILIKLDVEIVDLFKANIIQIETKYQTEVQNRE